MKHGIDLARQNVGNAIAILPGDAKTVGVIAATEEAWTVTGRERSCLIKKKQLGPASAAHDLAPPASEFA